MRISVRLAIILVVFSGHAWAKGKKGADKAAKSGAGMMDSNDPADKETADDGPFAPKHKSEETEAKEKKEAEATERPEIITRRPRDRGGIFGNVVIGFGRPVEPGPSADADALINKGTSVTFMAGGYYDVSPKFTLGLRIPWTTASERQLAGNDASSQALGTPELMGEYRVVLSPRTNLPIDFGVGIPVAQGNYDTVNGQPQYRQAVVNDFADAASGFRDGELFGPKRLPLIFGIGIDYERKEWNLHAATKFVAGFKVGGALDYGTIDETFGTYQLKKVTFRNVTSAGVGYRFVPKLGLALDSWFVTNAVNTVEFDSAAGATGPSRVQVVVEPRLVARFGKISPSFGYIFPLGGRLADNHTSGLELHCDVAF